MARESAAELVEELRRFTAERWMGEPPDVTRLRSFSLPPMGNLPCVAVLQLRPLLGGRTAAGLPAGGARGRPAPSGADGGLRAVARPNRRAYGEVGDGRDRDADPAAADVLRNWRPDTAQEFAVVIEHLMMAIDRIQAAVDAIVPWNELDGALRLRGSLSSPCFASMTSRPRRTASRYGSCSRTWGSATSGFRSTCSRARR